MGNTSQTDKNIKPSLSHAHSQDKTHLLQQEQSSLIPKSRRMKPLMGYDSHRNAADLAKMQKKRHYKKFWHLWAGDRPICGSANPKKDFEKINSVKHLHFTRSYWSENRNKRTVGPLKRLHRLSSLRLQASSIAERSVDDFYQIFRNLNSLKKLDLEMSLNSQGNPESNFLPIPQALKGCQGLRYFSIKLSGDKALTENLFGPFLSILKRNAKLETLSIDISCCSERARTVLTDTISKFKHPKLTTIYLKLDETVATSQSVFADLINTAPYLKTLYLHLTWTEIGERKVYTDEMLALSESLKKLNNLAELYVKIRAQDHLFALKNTKPLRDGLKSTNKLPPKFSIESTSFADFQINCQDFLDLYPRLISPNCFPEIQMCLNREQAYTTRGFCFKSQQNYPLGLSIAYTCPRSNSKIPEYNKEFCSFLDRVNGSYALTLGFINNYKVNPEILKRVFGCLEKFRSLKSLGLDISSCNTIDQNWIKNLSQCFTTLPQSLACLNLRFTQCISMTHQNLQVLISSFQNFKLLKNLKMLCLNFDGVYQITNENLLELGAELKGLSRLTFLNLSFRGCYLLDDQGAIGFLEKLKTAGALQEFQVDFEGCAKIKKVYQTLEFKKGTNN